MKAVLTINAGSSSVKLAAFDADGLRAFARQDLPLEGRGHEAVLESALRKLEHVEWIAVGHRIVHGGDLPGPRVIDAELLATLHELVPLAPLHQEHNLAGISAAQRLAPRAAQVACFDTSFHRSIPNVARRYALPRELGDLVAYGFHGISYEYIASVLPEHLGHVADGRVIVAHLGSGASMCALHRRASVATTMGFSPLDGLVMGTRPGSLDPGLLLYLLEQRGMSAAQVRDALYQRSGLLGISGISSDMKELLASDDRRAADAIELFVYRAVRSVGSLAAALGGLDALVFTGGIGEHSAEIRRRITNGSRWLGNFQVLAIPTDEELMIARHALALSE